MLIEFRVENHRSLRDEQVLTFETGRIGGDVDSRPRNVEGHTDPLLAVAALYGANASGKTNILAALQFGRDAVVYSQRFWAPEGGVDRNPFAWGPSASAPSLYEWSILLEGVRFDYGFVVDDERVLEEWLRAWPVGRKQVWFERDGDDFKFGDHLKGENRKIQEFTRANALYLSTAAQLHHPQLMPVFEWFSRVRTVDNPRLRLGPVEASTERMVREVMRAMGLTPQPFPVPDMSSTSGQHALLTLLRAADIGIVDLKVVEESSAPSRGAQWRGRILLKHRSMVEEAWLPLEQESHGTIKLLRMAPAILDALARGSLLVVDELETSMHPLLALHLVRQFNDPHTNPKNAQLLFTTHDTNLLGTTLGEPVLRRDQVWLVEKDEDGVSRAYPMTDYKPRKAENLERGYLQGRYGAIPFLGDLARLPE